MVCDQDSPRLPATPEALASAGQTCQSATKFVTPCLHSALTHIILVVGGPISKVEARCVLYCTLSVAIVECAIPDVPVTVMVYAPGGVPALPCVPPPLLPPPQEGNRSRVTNRDPQSRMPGSLLSLRRVGNTIFINVSPQTGTKGRRKLGISRWSFHSRL